jgi:ketosteroid isomerase-like protein
MMAGGPRSSRTLLPMTDATGESDVERFVAAFTAAWAAPRLEAFEALARPEVRLVQPVAPTTEGIEAFRDFFRRLMALIPDLSARVERWAPSDDGVYIELTFRGTLGGKPVSWRGIDRITLRDAKIAERVNYSDPVPILGAIATRPSSWLRWWRSGFGPPPRRAGH